MLKLLRFLITGSWHEHKWEIIERYKADIYTWKSEYKPEKTQHTIIQKCEVCGKLQEFTFTQGCII